MANDQLNFYSFVRRGMAAGLTEAGAKLSLDVTATEGKETSTDTVDIGLRLVGPEDIIGFDPRCIVKKRPDANTLDAEFDPYAMVEFDQPDLPWRYTPKAASDETLMPWIALIVLEESEAPVAQKPSDDKLAVLNVRQSLLPDLSKVPHWAHTQVTGTMTIDGKNEGLTDKLMARVPHKLVSRLICGRQLRDNRTYNAYLVPTFKRGRLAGLGEDPRKEEEGDAWDSTSDAPLPLPVYYQWSFKTGNVGSFRELALRLRPGILPSTIGWRAIDVSSPGLVPLPAAKDPAGNPIPMQVEGALQSPSAKDRGDVPAPDETQWVGALKTFIEDQEKEVTDPDNPQKKIIRKVVAPPLYGRWHANQQSIPDKDDSKPDGWFRTLNINPTLRVASALGTSVIQKEQEPLMASAWRQAGELPTINQALKVLQVGVEAYDRAYQRHFVPFAKETAFLQRLSSILGKIPFALYQENSETAKTVAGAVQETSLRVGVMSGAWRRLARPRSKLGRLGRPVEPKAVGWVNDGNWIGRPWDGLAGGLSLEDILKDAMVGKTDPERAQAFQDKGTNWLEFWGLACFWVGRKLLESKQGHYWWLVNRLIKCGTMLLRMAANPGWKGYDPWEPESPLNDPKELEPIQPPQSFPPPTSAPPNQPPTVPAQPPVEFLHPKRTLPWQFWRNVRINGQKVTSNSVDPIMAAPEFPQPMYQPLRDISKDWILPGISEFAGNTVAIALTNQKFIEAYMVGLNQEMARELVWRDYPTDRRGTCFRQFWDTRGRVKAPANAGITEKLDITRIHEWSKAGLLGKHRPPGAGDADNQVVLMVRGDLIVRYPNVVVYARLKGVTSTVTLYTIFQGMLPPDVGFYGFNLPVAAPSKTLAEELAKWEFVIQERPGELRFAKPEKLTGLPLELIPPTPDPSELPEPQFLYAKDSNGRSFAANTIRCPTRVLIDGSDLITST